MPIQNANPDACPLLRFDEDSDRVDVGGFVVALLDVDREGGTGAAMLVSNE